MMAIGRYGVRVAAAAFLAVVCLAGASPATALSDGGRGPGLYPGIHSRRTRPWIKATGEWRAGGSSLDQRTIVIDPGHGGLDVGAKGKFGSVEKDVDLSISLKLKALIEQSQSYRVVLTRDKDLDVSLENRAAIANNNDALVFLSIHVNGSFRKKARGSETFFMSLNATDEESRKLAYQENKEAALDKSIAGDDKDNIKMILWDMAQSAYIKQSSQLAELIQAQLNSLLGTENRGIKQANFAVLRGVACPAVLVEAAFISNPEEEQKLVDENFQNNVAQAVYAGLMRFLSVYGKN